MKYEFVVADGTKDNLHQAFQTLAEEYPLVEQGGDARVSFRPVPEEERACRIYKDGSGYRVEHTDLSSALRAMGTILARDDIPDGFEEKNAFDTFGIMLDVSRNAVMQVDHFKAWLRRLALLGFDMAMLYTEDTYALPDEPFFGYQRGPYTADELREIDGYARKLGIEMIPCVQTLGHMAQILKWPAYADVKDTDTVLLTEEEKTFALIEKIIRFWSEVFTTRRIHVGMDEAHDLGRGRYMDKHGYRDGFEIFNEHLDRVVKICEKYNRKPMIWSDMYFRLGSATGDYYDKDARVPDEVQVKIPKQAELVYWDYYHTDEAFYTDWIERHRALGFEPIMGSGVWTWGSVWHATNYTEAKAGACVRACKRAGLGEIFFTMWGDDGAMCDFDSALTGLTHVAELAYSDTVDEAMAAARFNAICGGDYERSRTAGALSFFEPEGTSDGDYSAGVNAWPTLWDDPLLGIYYNDVKARKREAWAQTLAHYREIAEKLADVETLGVDIRAGDLRHAKTMADVLAEKVELRIKLDHAYGERNMDTLKDIPDRAQKVAKLLAALDASYRRMWLRRNKPFGLEVVQVRVAGLIRRHLEVADRVQELVEGRVESIPELEDVPDVPSDVRKSYGRVCTACDNFA